MTTNFIGGRSNYSKSIQTTLTNNTITPFPQSAKAFKLHPNSNASAIQMWSTGLTGEDRYVQVLIQSGDAGTLFPFRCQFIRSVTLDSSDMDIEYLY